MLHKYLTLCTNAFISVYFTLFPMNITTFIDITDETYADQITAN